MRKMTKELLNDVLSWCYINGIITDSEYERIKTRARKYFGITE